MLISYISRGIGSLESFVPINPKPNYASDYEPAFVQQKMLDIIEQPEGDTSTTKGAILVSQEPFSVTKVVNEAVSDVIDILGLANKPSEAIVETVRTIPAAKNDLVDKDPRPNVFKATIAVPSADAFGLEPNVRSRLDSLPLE